jgi:hypothetical protein
LTQGVITSLPPLIQQPPLSRFWDGGAGAAELALRIEQNGTDYFLPVVDAVRIYGILFAAILPLNPFFEIPADRQSIVVLVDSWGAGFGPDGFDAESISKFIRRCESQAIIVSESADALSITNGTPSAPIDSAGAARLAAAYRDAASVAIGNRESVLIVHTTSLAHHAEWRKFIRSISPLGLVLKVQP